MLVMLVKALIFISFVGGAVFSAQVYDEYEQVKISNPNVSLMDVIRSQGDKWVEKAGEIARLEKKAKGEIKKIALGEVERALKMYHLDNNEYPSSIRNLVGVYIEKDAEIINDPSFSYRRIRDGYSLRIKLDTGERYEIRK